MESNNNDKHSKKTIDPALEEFKNELAQCKQSLKDAKDSISSMEKEKDRIKGVEDSLLKAKEELKMAGANYSRLENEKTKLENKLTALEDKRDDLLAILDDTKKTNAKQLSVQKGKNTRLSNKIDELEKQLNELNKENDIPLEKLSTSKSTYQIHLYQGEDQVSGKIEHPLTKDKKPFQGLDSNTIIAFLKHHMPKSKSGGDYIYPETGILEESTMPPLSTPTKEMFSLGEIKVMKLDSTNPSHLIDHKLPFKMQFKVEFTDMKIVSDPDIVFSIRIFARPLGGGSSRLLGNIVDIQNPDHTITAEIVSGILDQGNYRLEASMTAKSRTGKIVPTTSFKEGDLIYVH